MKKIINKHKVIAFTFFLIILFQTSAGHSIGDQDGISPWAQKAVLEARESGLIPKEIDNQYLKAITREEYCILALRILHKDLNVEGFSLSSSQGKPFKDIDFSMFKSQILKAYQLGIVKGDHKNDFMPKNLISREEICALITNMVRVFEKDLDLTKQKNIDFIDKKSISNWALQPVTYCYTENIMKGIDYLKIDPKGQSTKEQAIVLMSNFYKKYKGKIFLSNGNEPIKKNFKIDLKGVYEYLSSSDSGLSLSSINDSSFEFRFNRSEPMNQIKFTEIDSNSNSPAKNAQFEIFATDFRNIYFTNVIQKIVNQFPNSSKIIPLLNSKIEFIQQNNKLDDFNMDTNADGYSFLGESKKNAYYLVLKFEIP